MTDVDKVKERQRLANLINQWNQDHYDIFELSQPNELCEFHGVVRFYFQDGANVVTKCIRVASSATTDEVVSVLVEKFRPDMRMLSANKYALYEVHVNGEERRLGGQERVLYVQLNWGTEVREGRFLLKREGVPTISPHTEKENQPTFKRKLSKREKKEKKKQDKEQRKAEAGSAAEQLYTEMPETRFTRSISNPEAVMKRRRQQKVEKKLQQCRGQDGQGGTLKIYGQTINNDVPYKTLLLSTADPVRYVIRETMEKYGLEKEDPDDFMLAQMLVPTGEYRGDERIMEDHECPLAIAMDFPPSKGTMMFHFKRKPNEMKKPKHTKLRAVSHEDLRSSRESATEPTQQPFLVELNPDGSDNPKGKVYRLNLKITKVGSDPSMSIRVMGSNIQPRHCVLGLTQNDGMVTITPFSPEAKTYVDNQRVFETTTLQNGMTVRFGKLSMFRFIDPNFEEKLRKGQIPPDGALRGPPHPTKPLETDLDGDVRSDSMSPSPRDRHETEVKKRNMPNHMESPRDERGPVGPRPVADNLPAAIEYREDKEETYFMNVILDSGNSGAHFKLAPTYVIYMSVRFCLSSAYRPELSPQDRAVRITSMNNKIAELIHKAIHANRDNPAALAFWMANSSEILHFFKQDLDISPFSQDSQEMLAESVQMAFHHLVRCLQYDLERTMLAFLDENDDQDMNGDRNRGQYNRPRSSLEEVLDTLSSAMNLLRRCRVNAALTIQLFSQLFHFINMWLFNILVGEQNHQFCTRIWGVRLKRRLGSVEAWAEKQGLELAADCHLCRIIQAAHLLQAQKHSPDDIPDISSTCFKLNSLQLQELLVRYIPEPNEPPIPHSVIEGVVKIAENMADQQIKTEGREILLEEDSDLQLPFLLPEDGYSCDTVKGIPKGLDEFIDPLTRAGLCRMIPQPESSGDWTVYMAGDEGPRIDEAVRKGQNQQPPQPSPSQGQHPRDGSRPQPQLPKEPEVITVTFSKVKGSMGLSIVAATPESNEQKQKGIYIKSVVPGGAAALDGRLQAGDQLLEVDGKSLVGLSQEKGAELMTKTGLTVTLKVAKQGAFYHGLATLLSQPSPVMQRASPKKPASPQVNKQRPQEEGPPPYNGTPDMERNRNFPGPRDQPPFDKQRQVIQSPHSRSSPSLNKYRKGVTKKDMEIIYGRKQALWRLIMEADLQAYAKKQGPDLDSAPGAFSYQKPRSKSTTDLEAMDKLDVDVNENDENVFGETVLRNDINRPVPKSPSSSNMKKEEYVDLRQLQAELRVYKSGGYRNKAKQRETENRIRRSKSVGEIDKSNLMKGSYNGYKNVDMPRHQNGGIGMTHAKSSEHLREREAPNKVHDNHVGKMSVNSYQGPQPFAHRGPSYNSYQTPQQRMIRDGHVMDYTNGKNAGNYYPDHRRSWSGGQPYAENGYSRSYRGGPNTVYYESPDSVYAYNVPRGQQHKIPMNKPKQRVAHHQRSKSSSDLYTVTKGGSFSGDSYDSAHGSDSFHSSGMGQGRHTRGSTRYNRGSSRYSPPSSVGSYSSFKEKINHNFSDSGISDSMNSRGSYYLDIAEKANDRALQEPPLSRSLSFNSGSRPMLNSTMKDSWDRGSVTSNNSVSFSNGANYITRNPRNKNITSTRGLRDNMGPGPRATSTGNLRDQPPQHSPHGNRMPPQRDFREPDPKSKSIPNLRMDNSFEHRDPHPQHPNQQMRPAASVGTLQHGGQFHDYYNQGRNDPRGNDYENHPQMDPRFPRTPQEAVHPNNRGYPDVNHNMPPGQIVKPHIRPGLEQGPPSSRNSSSSIRDERPQSAYYGQQDRPEYREERPKSMEVTANKMNEMQQRFGQPQYSPHQSPHERSFDSDRDPNYMNTRGPQQPHMQGGYVNQSDIPKFTANNEARQPNFYENTTPRTNEPSPAFHQLRGPPPEDMKFRPQTMPKPSVAPKPNTPKVMPVEIPRVDVDNRQTQQNFFDPRMQQHDPRQPNMPPGHQNYIHGQPQMTSPSSLNDPRAGRGKFSPGREMYNPHQSPELPPPPQDVPPELPPPPALEDLTDELPPLPPPPANEYRGDPHMQSADPHYANANQGDPRFMSQPGFQPNRGNQPQQRVHPQQHFPSSQMRDNPRQVGFANSQPPQVQPQLQQPQQHGPLSATLPQRFQANHDYQNISYDKQNRSYDSPSQHSPNQNHVYESYDPKSQTLPPNSKLDVQQSRNRLMNEMSDLTNKAKKDSSALISPWDREEQDKQQKIREEELSRLRDQEITELESRQYLSPQDQERLRRFRLEQEFQRRVQEVSGRDEEDDDSDSEMTNRTQGREFLIQALQEDIMKAQRKMEDLNHRQQYEDFEREKDRMERLERKLEIFEREREERRQQMQKRQEKKQREHEEHLRKQREMREKQRQDYEEQKKMHMMEEEKLRKRQEEEQRKRKEMEKERLRELQAQRDQEEARLRAEARRREEEYQRQQMEIRERERREQEREIRVDEERKRLEVMALQNHSQSYQQYANLPAQSQFGAPPPPQRGSSYDVANNSQMSRSNPNVRGNNDMQNGFRNMNNNSNNNMSSSLRNLQDSSNFAPKKSVSFNTQLETQINRYSVSSESEKMPHASQSSYRSSHSSISSEQATPHSPISHVSQGQPVNSDISMNDTVFENSATPQQQQQNHIAYRASENTPSVVGAQEIYRDPRSRIMAQKEAQGGVGKKASNERMSFKDKMKFFAQEAGENTPKDKPRASKTLRHIESQLHNGQ